MPRRGRAPRARSSSRRRRGPASNEEGLRALGELVSRGPAAVQGDSFSSPHGEHRHGFGPRPPVEPAMVGLARLGDEMADDPPGGDQIGAASRHARRVATKRSRRRRWIKRSLLTTALVAFVLVGSTAGYLYYLSHNLNRTTVRGLHGAITTGAEAGTENILMVGSTSRCALAHQNSAYGLCSQGVNGVNSDVVMILHVNPAKRYLAILSIPRDLFIPNARSTGANKIDAGLYEGPTQLVAAIEEDFGIPIQHYVELNFDQFSNVVDALGGVNMSFPMSVFDGYSGLNVQANACAHLNGNEALEVVRARHLQYRSATTSSPYPRYWPQENLSDLARIRRDHEFLRVLATAVSKQGLGNPITDLNLVNSVAGDLTFDQTWSANDMVNLVLDFHGVDPNNAPQLTLPVSVDNLGSYVYDGGDYGDIEFPSTQLDLAAIDQVLQLDGKTDSMTGSPLPQPSSVAVAVENGTGAYNQATDTADALRPYGFNVVSTGDTTVRASRTETIVYYGQRSGPAEAAAEELVRSLSGSAIMAYSPGRVAPGSEVTLVTGSNFQVIAPPNLPAASTPASGAAGGSVQPATTTTAASTGSSGSGSGSGSGSSTPTSTTEPVASGFQAPSPTTQGLQPWDPRACAPGAQVSNPVANP